MPARQHAKPPTSAATTGYEAKLWKMADALRGSMDAAEYKHVVLGLFFLKYVSDAFEELHAKLEEDEYADPEDRDEYRAKSIFWVPPEARWERLKANAKQPGIGRMVDDSMVAVERDNPGLKDVLPKDYARQSMDQARLGQVIDMVSNIMVGDEAARSKDVLGRIYEYFLSRFAADEGKRGGQFYTPHCIVRLLVKMIEPFQGRVYDPCCGSSGMFVQSVEFIRAHQKPNENGEPGHAANGEPSAKPDISIYGQESNYTTWGLAKMNLAVRGIEGQIAQGDTFHNDLHPDLKADYILANPPFNVSDWGGDRLKEDQRWQFGVPPKGNANFAWVQHIVHHLSPRGVAGFVLANGSMSSHQKAELTIRRGLVAAELVDCIVALPGQLFYSTPIPACLWFLSRDRHSEILFIDARKLGRMVDRTHRTLTGEEISRITGTYHAWRTDSETDQYEDVPGFCKRASLEDVRGYDYVLTPGRYVGVEPQEEEEDEPFEVKMRRLTAEWHKQVAEARRLDVAIEANLAKLGFPPPNDDAPR